VVQFQRSSWIRNPKYLDQYAVFWFRKGGSPRSYSFWAADAMLQRAITLGNFDRAIDLLPDLIANYGQWEKACACSPTARRSAPVKPSAS
jgi:hypothetical protein